ncbi:MAG: hypothetical protein O0V67_02745, partial [Methanocorpusculum sp.]|nr:hypothetical protein [Methanocorpusculum sp.]
MGVQVTSLGPNKVDSFDTIGIETINLFLFAKMLVAQGFSAYHHFGIVSLWDLCRCLGQFTRNYTQTTKRGLLT